MASFVHFLKSLFIPLFLALTLYLLLVHLLLPFLRRNRQLYTSYLPVSAAPGSASSSSTFRSALANLLLPASVRERFFSPPSHSAHDIDADDLFDDEEGEGMIGFDDPISVRRREALEQRRSVLLDGVALGFGAGEDGERRLSRELEEGFRDESESESEDGEENGRGRWFP